MSGRRRASYGIFHSDLYHDLSNILNPNISVSTVLHQHESGRMISYVKIFSDWQNNARWWPSLRQIIWLILSNMSIERNWLVAAVWLQKRSWPPSNDFCQIRSICWDWLPSTLYLIIFVSDLYVHGSHCKSQLERARLNLRLEVSDHITQYFFPTLTSSFAVNEDWGLSTTSTLTAF